MEIETKYHGEIEVDEAEVIVFENGIPGFEEQRKFTLLSLDQETPFLILQSLHTKELGFVVVEPFSFFPSYEFELPDAVVDTLNLADKKDVFVLCILSIKEPFEKTTANLKAPVIINKKQNIGKQIVLNESEYMTRHLLAEDSLLREGQ